MAYRNRAIAARLKRAKNLSASIAKGKLIFFFLRKKLLIFHFPWICAETVELNPIRL